MPSTPRPMTCVEFLELIRASGLVDPEHLRNAYSDFQRDLSMPAGERLALTALGNYLVEHGIFTRWQCNKLQAGKYRGFFVDDFKFLRHLKTGDTYVTYLAEDMRTNKQVALHLISPPMKDGKLNYRITDVDA